ncbi:hypothetical protein LTR53_004883 [Teratosphaeriaceae sp. CCFEE 6253]|nr:hypothetical protein LTR53_004883 [Teratosphaeriaceae sp. CCFEE 6253]
MNGLPLNLESMHTSAPAPAPTTYFVAGRPPRDYALADTDATFCFYVPRSEISLVTETFATRPVGCGDDSDEFHASFVNWAVKMVQKPQARLSATAATIREILRAGFPETNVTEYIRALELFGKEIRWHYKPYKGYIKDPHSTRESYFARAELFAVLFSKAEKEILRAQHPDVYPLGRWQSEDEVLMPFGNADGTQMTERQYKNNCKNNWEGFPSAPQVAAQLGESGSGVAMRMRPGGDSDMARAMEGLGVSRPQDEGRGLADADMLEHDIKQEEEEEDANGMAWLTEVEESRDGERRIIWEQNPEIDAKPVM